MFKTRSAFVLIMLVCLCALLFVACNSNATDSTTAATTAAATETTTTRITTSTATKLATTAATTSAATTTAATTTAANAATTTTAATTTKATTAKATTKKTTTVVTTTRVTAVTTTTRRTTVTTTAVTTLPVYTGAPGSISICGTPISSYRIVIPSNPDLFTTYAAQNLVDYFKHNYDITLEIVKDSSVPTEHELIIGSTTRSGSSVASSTRLATDEYVLMLDGSSVIMYGRGYMVGAAAGRLITHYAADTLQGRNVNITNIPTWADATKFTYETPKNAILLIGDGMGPVHTKTGQLYFSANSMPYRGELITRSQSVINGRAGFTDSAAAGTALSTGFKTINGYIGVDPRGGSLLNLRELAAAAGAKTAVLSTDTITGATPAAFLAHLSDRNDTSGLQNQISSLLRYDKVDFAVGSLDDYNFRTVSANALQNISKNNSTFFAMIEEGHIDKRAHSNNLQGVSQTVDRFSDLIAYCMEFVFFHPDTLLIVTADHETGGLTEQFVFTSDEHTNANVPIYAMGSGGEYFDRAVRENTCVPYHIAKIFGNNNFGDHQYR